MLLPLNKMGFPRQYVMLENSPLILFPELASISLFVDSLWLAFQVVLAKAFSPIQVKVAYQKLYLQLMQLKLPCELILNHKRLLGRAYSTRNYKFSVYVFVSWSFINRISPHNNFNTKDKTRTQRKETHF